MTKRVIKFSIDHPRVIFTIVAILTLVLGSQIPRISIDTDPENMLPHDQPDRVFHDEVKQQFALYDMIVVGVVNDENPNGVFNPESLARVQKLTEEVQQIDGVIRQDVMSLSSVDNITQEGPGTIRFQWMMKEAPQTQEEALAVRDAARHLPLLDGSVVSDDGKALAIYVPIERKDQSYRIAQEIQIAVNQLGGNDDYHITGLPVAEDTFGVEMFKQMAISAPLSGLIIFILMWVFFRSFSLITSPMLLAIATVVSTMGLLIGMGFTVHIMSSMIPIFLMPIAVVDSVHILSEFADHYRKGADKREVVSEVMGDLFTPMLYTSLTSAVGFASLAFTPIPPVKVFGLFVAFGILLAFVLTVTFIPAYAVSLSDKQLEKMTTAGGGESGGEGLLGRVLHGSGQFVLSRGKLLIAAAVVVLGISAWGITKIEINDNPVRWFKEHHRIRVADEVLNEHFAGTYNAFLVLEAGDDAEVFSTFEKQAADVIARASSEGMDLTAAWKDLLSQAEGGNSGERLSALSLAIDDALFGGSDEAAPYLEDLLALAEKAQLQARVFQSPETLQYIEKLQTALLESGKVGKSNSIADVVKTVYRELLDGKDESYKLPDSSRGVAQALLSYQSSHRPDDLWHMVTPDYRASAVWVQLKSGDNRDMSAVVAAMEDYTASNPPPAGVSVDWAGLTYINVIWQEEMVVGMLESLAGSFIIVLIMMIVLFRSLSYGLLAMVPLSLTIAFIYGLIGIVGKDYDMPVAVLSSLTLGLSVDFAIHFLQRMRSIHQEVGDWRRTVEAMFEEPGRAISRNAIVIAIGFLPLLAAPLVPYMTVGFFLAAIMAVSCGVTMLLLPAIAAQLKSILFKDGANSEGSHSNA